MNKTKEVTPDRTIDYLQKIEAVLRRGKDTSTLFFNSPLVKEVVVNYASILNPHRLNPTGVICYKRGNDPVDTAVCEEGAQDLGYGSLYRFVKHFDRIKVLAYQRFGNNRAERLQLVKDGIMGALENMIRAEEQFKDQRRKQGLFVPDEDEPLNDYFKEEIVRFAAENPQEHGTCVTRPEVVATYKSK